MQNHAEFQYPLLVREHHLDTFGHVNNAVYLQIFEEARWQIVTDRNYGIEKIRETDQGPVIVEVHLNFTAELRLRDQVVIHTQLINYERKIAELKQWIVNKAGEVCCTAVFKLGLFDLRQRKLIAPTPEWLNALGAGPAS